MFAPRTRLGGMGFLLGLLALGGLPAEESRQATALPMLQDEPRIDGQGGKQEWLRGAKLPPLAEVESGKTADPKEEAWVGAGAKGVFVAFHLRRPASSLVPSESDTMEIAFSQKGKPAAGVFRVTGSGKKTAEGAWACVVRSTSDGWEGEALVPYTAIGMEAGNPDGWTVRLTSRRETPDAHVAETAGALSSSGAESPTLRLSQAGQFPGERAGAALELIGGSESKEVAVRATLLRQIATSKKKGDASITDTWVPYEKEMTFAEQWEAGGEELIAKNYAAVKSWKEEHSVPAERALRLSFSEPVGTGSYVVTVDVTEQATGRMVGSYAIPFVQTAPVALKVTPFLLTAKEVRVELDYTRFSQKPAEGKFAVEMKAADGKILAMGEAPIDGDAGKNVLSLKADGLFGQTVEVVARIEDGEGTVVSRSQQTLHLPKKPEWLGNGIGETDEPLPPWPPLKIAERKISLPLREIELGANGLPRSIVSRGRELLAAPMDILVGGKPMTWKTGSFQPGRAKASWVSEGAMGEVRARLETTIEYDGMIRVDLTLSPQGNQPVELKDWTLSMPYRAERAPRQRDIEQATFSPTFTLGDMETGIHWFCEAPRGWDWGRQAFLEVRKNGETLDWKVRFFGSAGTVLKEPLTITFGMLPLPVRELDLSYQYDQRRTTYAPQAWPAERATSTLRYEGGKLLNAEKGTVFLRGSWFVASGRIFQIGEGAEAFVVSTLRTRPSYSTQLVVSRGSLVVEDVTLKNPEVVKGRLDDVIRENSTWQPVALSWRKNGDRVELSLATISPFDRIRRADMSVAWTDWKAAVDSGGLIFGGEMDLGVDDIAMAGEALADPELLKLAKGEPVEHLSLWDTMEKVRFHRGLRKSLPSIDASGSGGIAGGKYSGIFVDTVAGVQGKGLLLKAGERSAVEVLRAYGVSYFLPIHEQFTQLPGYYTVEFMENAPLREVYRKWNREGMKTQMYGGFSLNGNADESVRGYGEELAFEPKNFSGAGYTPCPRTPAPDYYLWSWKRMLDYYGTYSGWFDNTVICDACNSMEHGCGWVDREGKLQASYPIFAAREFAKRMRWLFHVYRKEKLGEAGVFALHAGARNFFAVSDFADLHLTGEGWMSGMGEKFNLGVPEETWNRGYQFQLGVPVEILTKRGQFEFGPNWLAMYTLLNQQSLRLYGSYLEPYWWYIEPNKPSATMREKYGTFDPYYVEEGVKDIAAPFALWWQLLDDYDAQSAEFYPYWKVGKLLTLIGAQSRGAFYVHPGKDVLLVLCNFDAKAGDVEAAIDLKALKLDGKKLQARDAYTDEEYRFEGGRVTVPVPGRQYRLVRIEEP